MNSNIEKLPPCIVLGLETQIGLNIVRELGMAGVPVIGIAQEPDAIGLQSRYLMRHLVTDKPRSQELIGIIKALGREYGKCCLIAVSEVNLIWLAKNRDAFENVRPILPPQSALEIVLDKQKTLKIAEALGIEIPKTEEPQCIEDIEYLAKNFRFPAVLKWKDPNAIMHSLRTHGIDLLKAEYAYTDEEFLRIGRRYLPAGKWPLVQAYCPGTGLGQFFYMHDGQAIRRFQHIRIAEWPPEGGFSSVCDALPLSEHQALQEKSIALLKSIGWEGVAMVEYRFDPLTGRAVLMEINGRYWGSYPLAMHCGANFALLSYRMASGMKLENWPAPRSDIRCRMLATEVKRLVRVWFQAHLIADKSFKLNRVGELARFVGDFFRPRIRYYVWDRSDWHPFVADVGNMIKKVLRG